MKKIYLLGLICMFVFSASAFAAGPVTGDKALVDTAYDKGLVIPLDEFYASHPVPAGSPTRGDNVFTSPRVKIDVVTNVGPLIGLHYHASCEELVYIHKGQGEMYIDGKWQPVKAGQLHINPRGVIHATRVVGNEPMEVYSIFTPPQAFGNDKVMLSDSATGQVALPSLLDTKFSKGFVIDLNEFYASHALKAGEATRSDNVYQSPRIKVDMVTNRGPLIGRHHHTSCEEIVFVYQGQGEMYVGGEWIPVKAGDLHVNPRGMIHATRVTGDEDMKVFCVFAPPQAGGNDKVFLDK